MIQSHVMYNILRSFNRFERTASVQAQLLEEQTKNDFAEMRRLEEEKLARIREFSDASKTSRNWGYLSSITNNLTPIIPLVSGAALYQDKETSLAGTLLIGSSVASIANRIFQSSGIYDTIASWITPTNSLSETIASRLETGMQFVSYVSGLAGGYLAAKAPTVTSAVTSWATTGASWATTGMHLVTQGINFGQSFAERNIRYTQSDVQLTESQIQQRSQNIQQIAKESEKLTHTIAEIAEAVKSAIQLLDTRI